MNWCLSRRGWHTEAYNVIRNTRGGYRVTCGFKILAAEVETAVMPKHFVRNTMPNSRSPHDHSRTPPPVIEPNKRYFVADRMRWVLAVGNDHVIYSRGGDTHQECQVKTFQRWLKGESAPDSDAQPAGALGGPVTVSV